MSTLVSASVEQKCYPTPYPCCARVGDIVRTRRGVIGIVVSSERDEGNCTRTVRVLPFSFWLQILTFGLGFWFWRYYGEEIGELTLLHKAERGDMTQRELAYKYKKEV